MRIDTPYDIGDSVVIDGQEDICARVTAISIRGTGKNVTYEVKYFHNGDQREPWIEEWRLTPWVE